HSITSPPVKFCRQSSSPAGSEPIGRTSTSISQSSLQILKSPVAAGTVELAWPPRDLLCGVSAGPARGPVRAEARPVCWCHVWCHTWTNSLDSAPHPAHFEDWNFLISQEGGAGPPDPRL